MLGGTKLSLQNLRAQVFTCDNFISVKPVESKTSADVTKAFKQLAEEIKTLNEIVSDGSKEQTGKNLEFRNCVE